MKLNLGCGLRIMPKEEGWVNVDKFNMPGVDAVMDLFEYPWNFEDNSCDEFIMSHIVEHIPHEPKSISFNPLNVSALSIRDVWAQRRWNELKNLDGFFCWFAETWRIAKPGATVKITCPYGLSDGAFMDPTHTRYIVGKSFAYLTAEAQQNINWDYHLPFLFTVKSCMISIAPSEDVVAGLKGSRLSDLSIQVEIASRFNVGHDLIAELEVIK